MIGALLRALLFACGADAALSRRLELITPFTSFLSVREAVAYVDGGGSPFGGDHFHQSPLVLALFHPLVGAGEGCLPPALQWCTLRALFICIDLAIAASLAELCRQCVAHRGDAAEDSSVTEGGSALLAPAQLPATVCAVFLFNPYSLLSCAALSTGALAQLAMVRALLWSARGGVGRAMLWLALATVLAGSAHINIRRVATRAWHSIARAVMAGPSGCGVRGDCPPGGPRPVCRLCAHRGRRGWQRRLPANAPYVPSGRRLGSGARYGAVPSLRRHSPPRPVG